MMQYPEMGLWRDLRDKIKYAKRVINGGLMGFNDENGGLMGFNYEKL